MIEYLKMKIKVQIGKNKISKKFYNSNNIYIFLAADYPNMGDVAITYAQKQYLKTIFKNYNIIEIPLERTLSYIKDIKKHIKKGDIVTIVGGGNMGDIYEYYENLRRMIINTFKDNLIISFPQTIDFSNSKKGKKSLMKTQKVINKHKKILILARERRSYDIMKKYFNCKVMLVPDIVFSLKNNLKVNNTNTRYGIGVCFRDDKEKLINKDYIKQEILKNINLDVTSFTTYFDSNEFIYEKRYSQLLNLFSDISKFKFIITDRLHAMIFAYLTNTPCYFIDNSNKKLSYTYYTWLDKCDEIFEITEENYKKLINQINNQNFEYKYNLNCNLESEFSKLGKELMKYNGES